MWSRIVQCVTLSSLLVSPWLSASDTLSCRQLIDMVGQEQAPDVAKAEMLFRAASTTPQLKSIASQAMALLRIRTNQFSDAWKQATSQSEAMGEASRSVQLTQEKIKLWLLVEARNSKAEEQLKRLVSMTIHSDTDEADRQDASMYLGKLLRMLDESDATCGIAPATVDRAKQIMETQSSKTAVSMFQSGWTEAEQWEKELRGLLSKCHDKASTQAAVDEFTKQLESEQAKTEEAKRDQKQAKNIEDKLDRDRNGVLAQLKQVLAEMKRETPGKPKEPTRPHSKPSRPGSKADASDWRRYEREEAEYESKMRRYRDEHNSYEERLAKWREDDRLRRAQLSAQKMQLDQALEMAINSVRAQQAIVKEANLAVADQAKQLQAVDKQLDVAKMLLSRTESTPPTLAALQRPSLYPVLDFSRESSRLAKMVSAR